MSRSTRPHVSRRMRGAASALTLAGILAATAACGGGEPDTDDATAALPSPSETSAPSAAESPTTQSPTQSSTQSSAPAGEQEAETVEAQLVDFAIELDEDSFAAGTYEFAVTNDGDASHSFVVERDGEDVAATAILQPGQSETLTVDSEPGTYVIYCSVGNHRGMGMEVTVDVA